MHRLFVAIRPPGPIRQRLLDMMGGVHNARWQSEDQLHLTLRFIGELDRRRAEDVATALGGIRHPMFEASLSDVGIFAKRGKGALWVGVAPRDTFRFLHSKVDQACLRAGIAPDTRAYHPHITLARIGRDTAPVQPFLQRWAGVASPPFPVASIRLYESRLGSEGASYSVVAEYPLQACPARASC